jgi:hypothetical protein
MQIFDRKHASVFFSMSISKVGNGRHLTFGGKCIHTCGPSCIDSFEDEGNLVYGAVNEKLLGEIWFIGFDCLNQLPGAQQCRSKKNGEFSFLCHVGTPAFGMMQVGKAGRGSLLFLVPHVHPRFSQPAQDSGKVLDVNNHVCPEKPKTEEDVKTFEEFVRFFHFSIWKSVGALYFNAEVRGKGC